MNRLRKKTNICILILSICFIMSGCNLAKENKVEKNTERDEKIMESEKVSKLSYKQISQKTAKEMMDNEDCIIVDVRTLEEYEEGHIVDAVLLTNEEITEKTANEIFPDKEQMLLVYCRSGNRSKQASEKLANYEYTKVYEFGGINTWPYEIEVSKKPPISFAELSEEDLAPHFQEYDNVVILLSDGETQVALNESLAAERHYPYSTFKIPNSLIALEEGIITIDDSFRQWDGTQYIREEINQDHDLAMAMKNSCVWYYQELAREIGEDAMQSKLNAIGYGNMDISGGIDSFWLGSSLEISPKEQLEFIIRFYENNLPFSQENIEYVKSTMKQEDYPIDVFGKTGSSGKGLGWFVGYAILSEKPYFFVTYIEGNDASGLVARDKTVQLLIELL